MPRRPLARPGATGALRLLILATAMLAGCATVTPTATSGPIGSLTADPSPTATGGGSSAGPDRPSASPTGPSTPSPSPAPGIAWHRVAVPGAAAATERVAIGRLRVVVAVDGPSADGSLFGHIAFWSSTDTVHWAAAQAVPNADDAIVTSIAAVGDGFVAVGTDKAATRPRAWTSADGRRWSASPAIALGLATATAGSMTSVAVGNDGMLAGGFVDLPGQRVATAWRSRDGGHSWEPSIVEGSGPRAEVTGVSAGGPGWIAIGIRDATASFWESRDGAAWVHVVPKPPVGGGLGAESSADAVACTPSTCVVVGQGPSAGDGWAWRRGGPGDWATLAPADALTGGASRTVVAFGTGFVAGGAGPEGVFGVWMTADGRHWVAAASTTGPTGIVQDLATDGDRIVAVGPPFGGGSGFAIWIGAPTPGT